MKAPPHDNLARMEEPSWKKAYESHPKISEAELYDLVDKAIIEYGSKQGVGRGSRDICHEIVFVLAKATRPLRTGEIIDELEYRKSYTIIKLKKSSRRNAILRPLRCLKDAGLLKTWVVRVGEKGKRTDHYLAFKVDFHDVSDEDLAKKSIFDTLSKMSDRLQNIEDSTKAIETGMVGLDNELKDIKSSVKKLPKFY